MSRERGAPRSGDRSERMRLGADDKALQTTWTERRRRMSKERTPQRATFAPMLGSTCFFFAYFWFSHRPADGEASA
mgnify:CR=1 FL=1